jgi:hypothetical protein
MNTAPHGNDALSAAASGRVWIVTTGTSPLASAPLTNSLGSAK